jgi:hypothetical protein
MKQTQTVLYSMTRRTPKYKGLLIFLQNKLNLIVSAPNFNFPHFIPTQWWPTSSIKQTTTLHKIDSLKVALTDVKTMGPMGVKWSEMCKFCNIFTYFIQILVLFYSALQPPMGQGLLIHKVSRSHTTTHHSRQDSSGPAISSSQRPLHDNKQQSQ